MDIEYIIGLLVIFISIGFSIYYYYYVIKENKTEIEEESLDTEETEEIEVSDNKEVFNIYYNSFKYDEAESLCNALNSELATYDQVLDAYNNGAEWCNYGWSKDGIALYPMQNEKENCGNVGINGGYFNPELEFGVNCYGIKPNDIKYEEIDDTEISDTLKYVLENNETIINYHNQNDNKWSQYSS